MNMLNFALAIIICLTGSAGRNPALQKAVDQPGQTSFYDQPWSWFQETPVEFDDSSGSSQEMEMVHQTRTFLDLVHDDDGRYYKPVRTNVDLTWTRNNKTGEVSDPQLTVDVQFPDWGSSFNPRFETLSAYGSVSSNQKNITWSFSYRVKSDVKYRGVLDFGSISHLFSIHGEPE